VSRSSSPARTGRRRKRSPSASEGLPDKKGAAGGGSDRSNRLELDLARVLPGLRLVGCRGAVDVEEAFDPSHAWHLHDGFLDAGDLERVIDLAADGHHAGLDAEVDLTL